MKITKKFNIEKFDDSVQKLLLILFTIFLDNKIDLYKLLESYL